MTAFSPLVYSADVLQPVVNLGQRSTWSPTSWIQYLVWLESALGTLGVLVFGAIVSGLIKRD
jgi:heme A synthase